MTSMTIAGAVSIARLGVTLVVGSVSMVRVAWPVASVAISMTTITMSITMTIAHTVPIAGLGIGITLVVG